MKLQRQQQQMQPPQEEERNGSDGKLENAALGGVGVESTTSRHGRGTAATAATATAATDVAKNRKLNASHSLIAPPSISSTRETIRMETVSNGRSYKRRSESCLKEASKNSLESPLDSELANSNKGFNNIAGIASSNPSQADTKSTNQSQTSVAETNHQETGSQNKGTAEFNKMKSLEFTNNNVAKGLNVNENRSHYDVIVDGKAAPVPPGPARHSLDPNKAPGMPLENKDSLCGRLIHYVTGYSHPVNLSGTFVPGIRMDGATEGELPPEFFAQKGRAVKAFVNCFAGYFNTMGGAIPPCPGDCPPKDLNLNENSNNPGKKSAYEFPWSIRAGFMPEKIEVFDMMEDRSSGAKSKKPVKKQQISANPLTQTGKSPAAAATAAAATASPDPITATAPEKLTELVLAERSATSNTSNHQSRQNANYKLVINNNNVHGSGVLNASATSSATAAATAADASAPKSSASSASSLAGSISSAPKLNGSLWRGLQQHRQLQQQQRQMIQQQQRQRQNQQSRVLDWRLSETSQADSNPKEKPKLLSSLCEVPSIHQELRLRKSTSLVSESSSIKDDSSEENRLLQLLHRRNQDWRPTPASGML